MKKLITFVIAFCLTFNFVSAEVLETTETATPKNVEQTTIPENTTPPTSHLAEKEKVSYTFYHGDGCPHCAELDLFFKKRDAYNTFNIIKKEVWKNKENAKELSAKAKKLGITRVGVPFMVVNDGEKEFALSGTDKIQEYFTPLLQETASNPNTKLIILAILVILAVGVPFAFIKMSK